MQLWVWYLKKFIILISLSLPFYLKIDCYKSKIRSK